MNESQVGFEGYEGDIGEDAFQPPAGSELPDGPALEIFEGFGCKNVIGNPTPPDLRSLYDREEERLDAKLSLEAASRYRSTLGQLSWLAMTRVDLAYYVSMLARGQADPRERHERAMRAVLRYLKHVQSFQQVVKLKPMEEWELVLDCYVAHQQLMLLGAVRRTLIGKALAVVV